MFAWFENYLTSNYVYAQCMCKSTQRMTYELLCNSFTMNATNQSIKTWIIKRDEGICRYHLLTSRISYNTNIDFQHCFNIQALIQNNAHLAAASKAIPQNPIRKKFPNPPHPTSPYNRQTRHSRQPQHRQSQLHRALAEFTSAPLSMYSNCFSGAKTSPQPLDKAMPQPAHQVEATRALFKGLARKQG